MAKTSMSERRRSFGYHVGVSLSLTLRLKLPSTLHIEVESALEVTADYHVTSAV